MTTPEDRGDQSDSEADLRWRPVHAWRAVELLEQLLTARAPADQVIYRYFRQHKEMGSRDRGLVADAVYGCLRHKRLLLAITDGVPHCSIAQRLLAGYLLLERGFSGRALARFDAITQPLALAEAARNQNTAALPPAVRLSLPDDTYSRLAAALPADEIEKLMVAINKPADVDLRVNTLKASRDDLRQRLEAEGVALEPTPFAPDGLRHKARTPLFQRQEFKDGLFEIQDEGSQLISLLVDPRPRDTVVDFCAGGGGKSLHMSALMQNKGSIFALDVHERRLEELGKRRRRAGADNIRLHAIGSESDPWLATLKRQANRVLVDAPCSGSGTWRRNPDLKWRDWDLAALNRTQTAVLAAAADLVKPGGRLVYATCSLFPCENQEIVGFFMENNPEFTLLPAEDCLAPWDLSQRGLGRDGFLQLMPHLHRTDGFFAAVFQRG